MTRKVAICGRTNVGKSTLFNQLVGKGKSLVHDRENLTRDWVVESVGGIDLVDTAGMADKEEGRLADAAWAGSLGQVELADAVVFVVDARSGLVPGDEDLARELRRRCDPGKVVLAVNKVEALDAAVASAEFRKLGFGNMVAVASAHGIGLGDLLEAIGELVPVAGDESLDEEGEDGETVLRLALMGRPNTGKSTLANRLLGDSRMIVSDVPGTTVDSVASTLSHAGRRLELMDTAGIRRKARVTDDVERVSTRSARQAAELADVVLFMVDASEGVVHQDQLLANLVADYGRATVVILNKADLLGPAGKRKAVSRARRELPFMEHAQAVLVSVASPEFDPGRLLDTALDAHARACVRASPNRISKVLKAAVTENQPPRSHGRRPSLRYAHQAGTNPPMIVIHGRNTDLLRAPYIRYLAGRFTDALGYGGAPLHIRLKESPRRERAGG